MGRTNVFSFFLSLSPVSARRNGEGPLLAIKLYPHPEMRRADHLKKPQTPQRGEECSERFDSSEISLDQDWGKSFQSLLADEIYLSASTNPGTCCKAWLLLFLRHCQWHASIVKNAFL